MGFFDYPGGEAGEGSDDLVFLGEWKDLDWQHLLEYVQTQRFAPGTRVITSGGVDRALYLVASGRLEVVVGSGRRKQTIAVIDEGSVVGEQAFLDGRPAGFDVVAMTDVEALRLSLGDFETFAGHQPDLGRSLLLGLGRIVSLRLRDTTERLLRRR